MPDARSTGGRQQRIIARLLQSLVVVWAAATLTFALMRLAPGDPYSRPLDGAGLSKAAADALRAQRGLDQPMLVQYVRWLGLLARGNLGWSTMQQRPVAHVLREALPRTIGLMSLALVTSLAAGMALGTWQGSRVGTVGDEAASTVSLVVYSLPEFWLGMLLLQLFAQELQWLPAGGIVAPTHEYLPFGERLQDRARHLVLPWLTLSLVGTALFSRFQRASMREAWREAHVRTARAKGLPPWRVRWHAWRTALTPVIGLAGLTFPSLLGGAVLVERLFAWPGMGHATVAAVSARDYDLVTAAVLLGSAMTVVGTLLADLLQRRLDPRVAT